MALHDLIIVSDLHLGRGKNPETGRYYRLEAFFYDDDFLHFCAHLCDEARAKGGRLKLVLNGDTFDLLRIEPAPGGAGRDRYGPVLTPTTAVEIIRQVLAGHPGFVAALATVLAAGYQVVFLPGNHDAEMQWEVVQDEVRRAILVQVAAQAGNDAVVAAGERLGFETWFHHEPGRIWIEHGCQYDRENAFRYGLRRQIAALPDKVHREELDLPLGTFFQRYLYNGFGSITFIVPNSRSNFRYFRWLVFNRPRLLARVVTRHVPFFYQVLRRLARSVHSDEPLRKAHEAELDVMVQASPVGEKLRKIDALKEVHGSASILAGEIIRRTLKAAGFALVGGFLAAALWLIAFRALSTTAAGFGWKAILFLAVNFLFLVASCAGITYLLLRPASREYDVGAERAAGKIARLVDVPLVAFGHTHDEVIARIDTGKAERGWYFNTGTWIAVFTHDALLPRERVQYTFLRVRGHQGELLHWSPGRHDAAQVILLEDESIDDSAHPAEAHAT